MDPSLWNQYPLVQFRRKTLFYLASFIPKQKKKIAEKDNLLEQ